MCSVEYLREFVNERLTAAAEEIFGVFVKTMVQNEAELSQRRLQDITVKFPKIKLHRIDLSQQQPCDEEEQQLCDQERSSIPDQERSSIPDQERSSSLVQERSSIPDQERSSIPDQEEAEPRLIKEEQGEDGSSHESRLELKEESSTVMVTLTDRENDLREPEQNIKQLLSQKPPVVQEGATVGTESTNHAEPKKTCHRSRDHSVGGAATDTDLQQYPCKEEVLEDLYLFNLQNSGLDPEDLGPAQIKEEWEDGEQLPLDQKTKPLTCMYEDRSRCQPKPAAHLLLSHGSLHRNRTSADEKPFSCNLCERRFKYASKLKMHMSIHTGEKPFSCDACGKKFRRKDNLLVHIRTHTGEKPYTCNICGKAFRDSSNLIYHVRFHTGEKRYSCETCGKRFYHKGNLTAHTATHTGIKPYHCSTCGKRFACLANLKIHRRTHTGEKPYACAVCGKTFSQSTNLKFHTKIHTGEKPYSCKTCGKSFIQMRDLTVHIRTHTGEKPFSCQTCGKSFSQNSHLNVHMRTHTGEKPFSCRTCGKSFSQNSHLTVHMGSHTGENPAKAFGESFTQSAATVPTRAERQLLCRDFTSTSPLMDHSGTTQVLAEHQSTCSHSSE